MHAKTSSGFECGVKIKKFEVQEEKAQNLTVSEGNFSCENFFDLEVHIEKYNTIL
jgi:hypothetical protein